MINYYCIFKITQIFGITACRISIQKTITCNQYMQREHDKDLHLSTNTCQKQSAPMYYVFHLHDEIDHSSAAVIFAVCTVF